MKAKQASAHPKLVTQLERQACFCPPTMHFTKLGQLNKVRMEVKASIAKALSGLATISDQVKQQYCKQVLIVRAEVDNAIKRQTSKLQCSSLTQRNV